MSSEHLDNWYILNQVIASLDEKKCAALIREEMVGRRRAVFLKRLHGRHNTLRIQRERDLIEKGKF